MKVGSWCYGKEAYSIRYALYPRRYRDKSNMTSDIDVTGNQRWDAIYWWRCFIAAAQRMIKKPI